MTGVNSGPDSRWECLYVAQRERLYRAAAAMVGAEEAEDVVQEAFARAINESDFFDEVRNPSAWLQRVVVRLAITRLRRRALTERIVARFRPHPPEQDLEIEWALRRLPATQRGAVILRYYFRAGYDEIAAALGLSAASVGKILTRARAALREDLS